MHGLIQSFNNYNLQLFTVIVCFSTYLVEISTRKIARIAHLNHRLTNTRLGMYRRADSR